ncbi:MAG: translation elongation factor Ts [Firmicutes bacterium]|nr:translation elongation factor Ts [Bacillota bacterium]
MISAEMVRDLRERTGAGMMDCKRALTDADGNMEKAIDLLREKGLAAAAKKAGRIAAEGIVESYIHGGGRIGVLVEVNCETDFVAKTDEYKEFCRDIAMQIAAANPEYVRREDVPTDVLEREKSIARAQAINDGKPEKILDKIVNGRIEKFYKEVCLMEQVYIKNNDQSVSQYLTEKIAKMGENISIRRFARFAVGEGIEKRQDDLAAEVAKINAGK